jgi:hypothetical protein
MGLEAENLRGKCTGLLPATLDPNGCPCVQINRLWSELSCEAYPGQQRSDDGRRLSRALGVRCRQKRLAASQPNVDSGEVHAALKTEHRQLHPLAPSMQPNPLLDPKPLGDCGWNPKERVQLPLSLSSFPHPPISFSLSTAPHLPPLFSTLSSRRQALSCPKFHPLYSIQLRRWRTRKRFITKRAYHRIS